VGFIRDMPAELFTSFTATLEEVRQADLVLHVIDMTHPDWTGQKSEVEKVLRQLGVDPARVIPVFNKIDLFQDRERPGAGGEEGQVFVSAIEGTGLATLQQEVFRRYFADYAAFTVDVDDEQQLDALGRWAIVVEKSRVGAGFRAAVLCSREKMLQFSKRTEE